MNHLEYVIRPGNIKVPSKSIEAVKVFKSPQMQTQLRSFLSLYNLYRRLVPNLSRVVAPFNKLLKKKTTFWLAELDPDKMAALNSLKQALIKPPVVEVT